jgi:hypothetical protein
LVRNSPALRACQREILARSGQAAAPADETGAPDAAELFIAAAGLVSVFRVNLKGRDSDTEPPVQRAERALDLLEHVLGDYAVSPPHHLPRRAEMPDLRASRPHRDPPAGRAGRI